MFSRQLVKKAELLLEAFRVASKILVTAESCTGGLVSACLTEIPGSSNVFTHGFVTYSNKSKIETLNVSESLIERAGAVSEEVSVAMALGALARTPADLAVAVTGVAGPGGGTLEKPVGLVHFAVVGRNTATSHQKIIIPGERSVVRMTSVSISLDMLLESIRHL